MWTVDVDLCGLWVALVAGGGRMDGRSVATDNSMKMLNPPVIAFLMRNFNSTQIVTKL